MVSRDVSWLVANSLRFPVSLGLDEQDTDKASLEVYKADFEAPFINATEKYYTLESEAFLTHSQTT